MTRVSINGKYFEVAASEDGKATIQRRRINDWPQPVPNSGKQDPLTSFLRQVVHIGDIRNAFAGNLLTSGAAIDPHLEHGHMHDLADSTCETRFSRIQKGRNKNTPALPALTGDEDVAGQGAGAHNYNPKAAVFFEGTSASGVYTWIKDDGASNNLSAAYWDGTAWQSFALHPSDAASYDAYAVTVHKGQLTYFAMRGAANQIKSSTTGNTYADRSNAPATAPAAGTRLLDDGNRLWAFVQDSGTAGTFKIEYTDDFGGTAWTALSPAWVGQLRDVGFFYDRDGNSQIVILTTTALYWLDQSNSALERLLDLPFGGRAMTQYGSDLLIVMDSFKVLLYSANGATSFISPELPSPYNFDTDTGSHACIGASISGPYVFYSGDTISGNDAALILQYRKKEIGEGWHYIWHEASAQQGHAARFIYIDPVSGDLIGAINSTSSNADLSTGLQFKDIEIDPADMSTKDYNTSDTKIVFQRTNFGSSSVKTTVLKLGVESDDVDATETLTPAYGADGAASNNVSLPAITSDNGSSAFPGPTSASAQGVSVTDLQGQLTFASGGATLSPKVAEVYMTYLKVPDARYVYIVPVRVEPNQDGARQNVGTFADIDTIEDTKTLITLAYGGRSVSVLPIAESEVREQIYDDLNPAQQTRDADWTFFLAEVD